MAEQKLVTVLAAGLVGRGLVASEAAEAPGFDTVNAVFDAIDRQTVEIEQLKRSIAGHKGLTTRERKRAEALEAQLPAKPRKFGDIETPLKASELLELIEDAKTVELAFVGPKGVEVEGLAPRSIGGDGDAWQVRGQRLFLNVPSLVVHGPEATAKRPRELHGYALLVDGELVASTARDPLRIGPGQRLELKGDVVFGGA